MKRPFQSSGHNPELFVTYPCNLHPIERQVTVAMCDLERLFGEATIVEYGDGGWICEWLVVFEGGTRAVIFAFAPRRTAFASMIFWNISGTSVAACDYVLDAIRPLINIKEAA
jgi:hypothetical protein